MSRSPSSLRRTKPPRGHCSPPEITCKRRTTCRNGTRVDASVASAPGQASNAARIDRRGRFVRPRRKKMLMIGGGPRRFCGVGDYGRQGSPERKVPKGTSHRHAARVLGLAPCPLMPAMTVQARRDTVLKRWPRSTYPFGAHARRCAVSCARFRRPASRGRSAIATIAKPSRTMLATLTPCWTNMAARRSCKFRPAT